MVKEAHLDGWAHPSLPCYLLLDTSWQPRGTVIYATFLPMAPGIWDEIKEERHLALSGNTPRKHRDLRSWWAEDLRGCRPLLGPPQGQRGLGRHPGALGPVLMQTLLGSGHLRSCFTSSFTQRSGRRKNLQNSCLLQKRSCLRVGPHLTQLCL